MAKEFFNNNRTTFNKPSPTGDGNAPQNRDRRDNRDNIKTEHRINFQIRVPEVRLVGDSLEALSAIVGINIEPGVYSTYDCRKWAEAIEQDLVEISPNAAPPVVRIMDYNKFLYQKKKKEKELKAKTSKTVIKEIRFGPNTDDHDFEFKTRHAKEFLGEGAKVKAFVQFKGRAIVFKGRGEDLLGRFIQELSEDGMPESPPKLEGKKMFVLLVPKKKK